MVRCRTLRVHLLVVVEEVRVDAANEPRLFGDCLLDEDKKWAGDPVNERACRPRVRKGQVEELKDLEEGAESVDEPVLILFGNPTLSQTG